MFKRKNKEHVKTKKTWSGKKKLGFGVLAVLILGACYLYLSSQIGGSAKVEKGYTSSVVKRGNIASSTLLTGSVKPLSEQYVYYDSSKGSNATVSVNVGDHVTAGQQLVQYDSTVAQADYDTAVRAQNKAARDLEDFKKTGVATTDAETGETVYVKSGTTYDQQLQSLNDALADAQAAVAKAQTVLNQTMVLSDVSGTVVEVNNDVDPSSKESQTLVHVTSEGQLQVQGTLTEYDLANVSTGQEVTITSKVYPDKTWKGTISSISNYPNKKETGSTDGSSTGKNNSAATYDYKVDITSDLGDLKQGFTVSVQVDNTSEALLVPISSVVNKGNKNYVWVYDKKSKKVTKTEVTIGNADASHQAVSTGLNEGQSVITNPDSQLVDGDKVSDVTAAKE
ncbi:efflux RND transporter periplasmic adaptor subunit [Streptococcus dentiloxodontae]